MTCSLNGHTWLAKWWTQGELPPGTSGAWLDNGPCSGGGGGTPTATPTIGPTSPPGSVNLHRAIYLMPYNNPIPIAQYMNETGYKSFMISFVLSGGGCTPTWDGTHSIGDSGAASIINAIRANGGDVAASVGGYGGTKLGQTCGSGSATASAYQQVVSAYGLKAMDFDIEEPEIEISGAVSNELDAANAIAGQGLAVSITMPTTTAGLNYFGGLTADAAYAKGMCSKSNIHWRIMPFDGGFSQPGGTEAAAQAFHDQMMTHCHWDSATAWSRLGISGMNGRSDTGEYTTLQNWKDIISWANSQGIPDLTFWAQQRDRDCTALYGQVDPGTKGDCSSVSQTEGAFGLALK
jgi:chitinase